MSRRSKKLGKYGQIKIFILTAIGIVSTAPVLDYAIPIPYKGLTNGKECFTTSSMMSLVPCFSSSHSCPPMKPSHMQ